MTESSIARVLSGGDTYTGHELRGRKRSYLLATDTERGWGAWFTFFVARNGDFSSCASLACWSPDDDAWLHVGSTEAQGTGWKTPWRRSGAGWDGDPLRYMGGPWQQHGDVIVSASPGFASEAVASLRVEHDGHERQIAVSPVGAFIVLSVGKGSSVITPLDRDGAPLIEPP